MGESGTDICPFGEFYQPWWDIRYKLFSRFDDLQIDPHGLYTVAPEQLAMNIAEATPGSTLLDICSGVGSMSIAFARSGKTVTAVEIDKQRVEMARHNAGVYDVSDQIEFMEADVTDASIRRVFSKDFDTVWLDPPWGTGPGEYAQRRSISLADLALAGVGLQELVRQINCRHVVMRLPFNFNQTMLRANRDAVVPHFTSGRKIYCFSIYLEKQRFLDLGN